MLDLEPRNKYEIEYTDTFVGEANYCWVKRSTFEMPLAQNDDYASRKRYIATLKKRAKQLVGLTGLRGEWSEYGDCLEFRPRGMCVVLFVNYVD